MLLRMMQCNRYVGRMTACETSIEGRRTRISDERVDGACLDNRDRIIDIPLQMIKLNNCENCSFALG